MFLDFTPAEVARFFITYGITGVVPLIAALYLLLRRGNAFAADITSPIRLRRWAASFFAVSALSHVWWYIYYVHSDGLVSLGWGYGSPHFVADVMLDCLTLMTTIAGTLLAMLQDRRRSVWPVFVAMSPFVVLAVVIMFSPSLRLFHVAIAYVLLLYLLFSVYILFAVRQYGRWLRDNYADLERKEVWGTHVVSLFFTLLFFLYTVVEDDITLIYLLHLVEIVLFVLLLWRVETLPQLDEMAAEPAFPSAVHQVPDLQPDTPKSNQADVLGTDSRQPTSVPSNIDFAEIERLLEGRCVATRLYLQYDLSLQQLAKALGTNRSYLSLYFSRLGINYNTYINNLRINHFISRYQEVADQQQPFTVQQLANDSGYRSYSTFSLAFKQRMGQSVTAWMREVGE